MLVVGILIGVYVGIKLLKRNQLKNKHCVQLL